MSHSGNGRHCFSFAEFRLYPEERLLVRDGERIALTPRVLDFLIVLVDRHYEVVNKEMLLEAVWPDSFVEEGNINRTVSTLRKSLGKQSNGSDFIETVPKTGYRFIAPVLKGVEEPEPEILALPWSAVRRPVFWASAVAAVVMLVLLVSSYVTSPFGSQAKDGETAKVQEPVSDKPLRLTFHTARDAYPQWTQEGRIRYQHNGRNPQGESYIMDPNGENRTHVTDIPNLRQGGWSPDGMRLIFWRYNDPSVYLADADGKNEKKLPFIPGGIQWSPDGTRLVYQNVVLKGDIKDADIFVYDVTSGHSVNLTNNPAFEADPSWSPTGKEIVFNSNREGNLEIYLMSSDGTGLRRLTDHPAWDSHPAFSPDGTQIIFSSNRENETSDLYLMNADGSGNSRLTDWEGDEEVGPGCWSPDGTQIAFMSDRSGDDDIYVMSVEPFRPQLLLADENDNISAATYSPDGKRLVYQAELPDKSGELRVHDLETGEVRSIVTAANWNLRPVWSPDGSRIVFRNNVGAKTALFLIDPDGNRLTSLSDNSTNDGAPSWSPDGTQVVFVALNYGPGRLFTVTAETGEQRALTPLEGWESEPTWSPDGTKIAFSCDRVDLPGNGMDICLIDADGNNERRLLSHRGHDTQPAWSPDGSRFVFVSTSDGNKEIYTVNADGTGLLRLTRNTSDDIIPKWSPDGKRVIFSSNRSGKYAVYEIVL